MNRFYSSGFGRFMSPDLLSGSAMSPQSLNRYAYVLNDPVNLTDPLGLEAPGTQPSPGPPPGGGPLNIGDPFANEWACALYGELCPDPGPLPFQIGGGHGGGGGANGQTNPANTKPKVNLQALMDCIFAQFGVTLLGFQESIPGEPAISGGGVAPDIPGVPGINGSFTGLGPDIRDNGGLGYGAIEVTNDINTLSKRQISMINMAPSVGLTFPSANLATINFTANDIKDPNQALDTQIYELGNSLGVITGQATAQSVKSVNAEPGQATLDCYNKLSGGSK